MSNNEHDWKSERVRVLEESLTFFSNAGKLNREKWVVRRLLKALRVDFQEQEMTEAEEPVDVAFRDIGFQVKEILDQGRHRTDEFRASLDMVKMAESPKDLLEHYEPSNITFSELVERCHEYASTLLKKYGPRGCMGIDLLCYFNFQAGVTAPIETQTREVGFKSFSVVSNRYCAVIYATSDASVLLRDNVGKVVEYFEL